MFGVYLHEHGGNSTLLHIDRIRQARDFIDNYTDDFLLQKNGETPVRNQLGFYKTSNFRDSMTKLTVWEKFRNKGILYNTYTTRKVFEIDMVYIPETQMVYRLEDYYDSDWDCVDPEYIMIMTNEVLPEIRSNISSDCSDNLDKHFI